MRALAESLMEYVRVGGEDGAGAQDPKLLLDHIDTIVYWALGRIPSDFGSQSQRLRAAAIVFIKRVCFAPNNTHYEVLGLNPEEVLDSKVLRRRYRAMIRLTHPDVGISSLLPGTASRVNRANSVLSDPDQRRRYDRQLERTFESAQAPEPIRTARRTIWRWPRKVWRHTRTLFVRYPKLMRAASIGVAASVLPILAVVWFVLGTSGRTVLVANKKTVQSPAPRAYQRVLSPDQAHTESITRLAATEIQAQTRKPKPATSFAPKQTWRPEPKSELAQGTAGAAPVAEAVLPGVGARSGRLPGAAGTMPAIATTASTTVSGVIPSQSQAEQAGEPSKLPVATSAPTRVKPGLEATLTADPAVAVVPRASVTEEPTRNSREANTDRTVKGPAVQTNARQTVEDKAQKQKSTEPPTSSPQSSRTVDRSLPGSGARASTGHSTTPTPALSVIRPSTEANVQPSVVPAPKTEITVASKTTVALAAANPHSMLEAPVEKITAERIASAPADQVSAREGRQSEPKEHGAAKSSAPRSQPVPATARDLPSTAARTRESGRAAPSPVAALSEPDMEARVQPPVAREFLSAITDQLGSPADARRMQAYLRNQNVKGALLQPVLNGLSDDRRPQVERLRWTESAGPGTLTLDLIIRIQSPRTEAQLFQITAEFKTAAGSLSLVRLNSRRAG